MRLIPNKSEEVLFKINRKFVILLLGMVTYGVILSKVLDFLVYFILR